MVCVTDYDGVKKCLKRSRCTECVYNDQCPSSAPACVPTRDGTSKYCTSTCKSQNDCPGSAQAIAFMQCVPGQDADGNVGSFCFHKYGACVGTGEICDPCRVKEDCAKSSSSCIENDQTGERMCSKRCTSEASCASTNVTGCDNVDMSSSLNICTGDAAHNNPGVLTCWF